jgi:hypothetical protein
MVEEELECVEVANEDLLEAQYVHVHHSLPANNLKVNLKL